MGPRPYRSAMDNRADPVTRFAGRTGIAHADREDVLHAPDDSPKDGMT